MEGNKKIIRLIVFSIRRSGTHAVIEQLCRQAESAIHYNNVTIKNVLGNSIRPSAKGTKQKRYGKPPFALHIYNFEDTPIDYSAKHYLSLTNAKYVIILRDPYNIIASRLKKWGKADKSIMKLWKEHANEYLHSEDIIGINFNYWFSNKEYRQDLAERIGIVFSDDGIEKQSAIGSSSFEENDKNARKLNVLNRYKQYATDSEFIKLFDEETKKLSEECFGIRNI